MIPRPIRVAKHAVFQFLPGTIGMRNRACLRRLTSSGANEAFERALSGLDRASVCIDCGANVGSVTVRLASRAGKIFAFEPDPWAVERLREATRDLSNVTVIEAAVGDRDGSITLHRALDFDEHPEASSVATTVMCGQHGPVGRTHEARLVDLSRFFESLGTRIAILKMDIEGAEVSVLERLLERSDLDRIDHIFVETHELLFPELLARTEALRERVAGIRSPFINMDWH